MNIDSIKNGIVIDHIHAGGAMELYRLLNLDKLDCTVALSLIHIWPRPWARPPWGGAWR